MTYVKVCGLRSIAEVDAARAAGADAVGVVMSSRSPRHVDVDTARTVVAASTGLDAVLVTNELDPLHAARVARDIGADALQLHGHLDAATVERVRTVIPRVWIATSVRQPLSVQVGALGEDVHLFDAARPGSGKRWDVSLLHPRPTGRWMLAGGLSPANVREAIVEASPWGVDVSSGVESAPGIKDLALIAAFVARAKGALDARETH